MFTGIIESLGEIAAIEPKGVDRRLLIAGRSLDTAGLGLGESVAVNGVCLTVAERSAAGFWADVSAESLDKTTLGAFGPGAAVNLERALTPQTRLGGHLVGGHVDGVGQVRALREDGRSWRLEFEAPAELARYIAAKGSICIDGVSLTVNEVSGARFGVNIVPHTWTETVIAGYRPGTRVNLEVDLIARYLERLLLGQQAADPKGLTLEALARAGFAGSGDA
jgi:riboflavin synthase